MKLHRVLDHEGYLSQFAVVTPGKAADHGRGIVRDEIILLVRFQEQGPEALIRPIEVESEDGETVVFVTNYRKLRPRRWRPYTASGG